ADADKEAELPQLLLLFDAAGKAVHHAAQWFAEPAQFENHRFEGMACVQHQRQIEPVGDFELSAQEVHLPFAVEAGPHVIEAALADGSGRVRSQPCIERGKIAFNVLRQVAGMQPVGGMQAGLGSAKGLQLWPACRGDGGDEHLRDACRAGVMQYTRAVAVEFWCVQVRMAVEDLGVWAKSGHWSTLK